MEAHFVNSSVSRGVPLLLGNGSGQEILGTFKIVSVIRPNELNRDSAASEIFK